MIAPSQNSRKIVFDTGALKMPVVEMSDGRWMSDTTPMIQFLESELTGPNVILDHPLQNFISLLIEDYADEWLW